MQGSVRTGGRVGVEPTGELPSGMYTRPPKDPIKKVDWLLKHMVENLNEDLSKPFVWQFTLRPKDVAMLDRLGDALEAKGFGVMGQESLHETVVDSKGKSRDFVGPPLLIAYVTGVLNAKQVKAHVRTMLAIAAKEKIAYDGVEPMSIDEFEEFHGPARPKSVDDASWLLKHFTDTGLKPGGKLAYYFCVRAKDPKSCAAALKKAGYRKAKLARADDSWDVDVVVGGKNDEKLLRKEFAAMKKAAHAAGGRLAGVLM